MIRAFVIAAAVCSIAAAAQAAENLFECDIGDKQLSLTVSDNQVRYEYGPNGAPELTMESELSDGAASWRYDLFNRAENKMLRFQRGDYSYVVFNIWSAPNSDMTGARDFSGVLVFKQDQEIARLFCSNGGEFNTKIDLSMMPEAREDLVDLIMLIEDPKAADDEIREFGVLTSVEDGPYPMVSLTLEFPARRMVQSFTMNVEDVGADIGSLYDMVGAYVTIFYRAEVTPDLLYVMMDGNVVSRLGEGSSTSETLAVHGVLSGAEKVTESDLPGEVTVDSADGGSVAFPLFVPPELTHANGEYVTAYYQNWRQHIITGIEMSD